MNKKTTIVTLVILVLIISLVAIAYNKTLRTADSNDYNDSHDYKDFNNLYLKILKEFNSDNYVLITDKNTESRVVNVFPEGLYFEKRKTNCINDDPEKPSKFEMFFKDKDETILLKLSLFFTPGNPNKGIVFYQVISPEDNINLEGKYTGIPRPIMVETYESFGDYGIFVNTLSINQETSKSIEKETIDAISNNWDFIKQLEVFLH